MNRVEQAAEASFSLSVWSRERNCVVCGEPASNAHHILWGQHLRENVLANGLMLCGSGTTGCHGKVHAHDVPTRKAIGEYIVRKRPDTLAYLHAKLGVGWLSFLHRVYHWEGEMNAPQDGTVDAATVILYEDANGEYRWRAQDTNNEMVADSGDDGYADKATAEKAATDLFPGAVIKREWEDD